MAKTLGLVHTSLVFINVETMMNDIFSECMPEVRRINFVDDALLSDVVAAGGTISPQVTRRMCALVQSAEISGCDAVLSLCSSLGPTIDVARNLVSIPVIKIDDAMTRVAVQSGERIGVMATVATTLGPTVGLLQSKAVEAGKTVDLHKAFVEGAFQTLMRGERDKHDEMVAQAACSLAPDVDLIVLAQASMTRLAPRLQALTGKTVLSSPRLGIEYTRQVLLGCE